MVDHTKLDLFVVVTGKWYDMLEQGIKLHEYRKITPYWIRRLIKIDYPEETKGEKRLIPFDIVFDLEKHDWKEVLKGYYSEFKSFETVTFQHGYAKDARRMTFDFEGLDIGPAVAEWIDDWACDVFRIKVGQRVKTREKISKKRNGDKSFDLSPPSKLTLSRQI